MKAEKVSVIIPAYNCERYLEQCVQSVLAQTYSNIEVIIVNDGSTDSTGKVAELLKEQDNRIRVLHKSNSGEGPTRNIGLDLAVGDYILFVDADDWIDPNHIKDLHQSLIDTGSDIAVTNLSQYYDESGKYRIHITKEDYYQEVYTPQEWFKMQYGKPNFLSIAFTVPWCKLYKASLFEDILYPAKAAADDYTTWKLYLLSDKIVYTHTASYVYRVNESSLTATRETGDIFKFETVEERLSLLSAAGFDVTDEIAAYEWRLAVNKQPRLDSGDIAAYQDIVFKMKVIQKYKK